VSEPLPETAADPSAPAPFETQAELTATEARASLTEASSSEPAPSATRGVGRAALIEVLAYGTNIAIRLGSNLILTRLLFPKAFGLMALFHSVNYVLWMLSDVGITQAVVMSKRGNEQKFLDTAYTIQATRGIILWAATSLLAWPVAHLYQEPDLLWIMPIGSFATVIHGFQSPRVFLLRKQLRPLPLLKLDLSTHFIATGLTVVLAYMGYGLTALVVSFLSVAIIYTAGSHVLPGSDYRPKWGMEKESRQEFMHFGRWIFLSSCLTAVANKGDMFLLGRLLGVQSLGLYQIALQLAEMPENLVGNVVNSVVYPALSRVKNEQPAAFARTYYKIRLWLDALVFTALGGLIGIASWLIDLMYDARYALAAVVLRVLAVRTAIQVLASLCESCFTAHGESQFSFKRNLYVSATLMVAMPIGAWQWGFEGVLWGSVAARSMSLVALWPEARRRGYLKLHRELPSLLHLASGYALGLLLAWSLPAPTAIRLWLKQLFGMD
jgi:O-antigen/teichoic acid export membrane protein